MRGLSARGCFCMASVLLVGLLGASAFGQTGSHAYLGFDSNNYPGNANLKILRQTFAYTGYWLNNPPSAKSNGWLGKRPTVEAAGFGFLVLFNGRLDKELRHNAAALAQADAEQAVAAAKHEGFPARTIIFLDIEEGGRMLPEQKTYIYGWADAVRAAGYRAGVYCSGIPAREDKHTTVVTADDLRAYAQGREITYWVTNDSCPPSPGCTVSRSVSPAESGIAFADVWQFAQSPRRKDFAAMCHNYNPDERCYPPGIEPSSHVHVDMDTANSSDPSQGR